MIGQESQSFLPGFDHLTTYNSNPQKREIIADVMLFGGGLNSWTMLDLITKGVLSAPEVAIFSDTGADPSWVYHKMHEARLAIYDLCCGFMSVRYSPDPVYDTLFGDCHGSPPFWLASGKKRPGRLDRQCTAYWKIQTGQRAIKFMLHEERLAKFKIKPGRDWYGHGFDGWEFSRFPRGLGVRVWVGYTTDEMRRVWKPRAIKWETPYYPLIELGMSREDCKSHWLDQGLEPPRRSSCIFCPNRADDEWLDLAENYPDMFNEACRVDGLLRSTSWNPASPFYRVRSSMFVHKSLKPLREAILQ